MGDPAGIGPEICLQAVNDPETTSRANSLLFGDAAVAKAVARRCNLVLPRPVVPLAEWKKRPSAPAGLVDCSDGHDEVEPGRISAACGRASVRYIEAAVEAVLEGQAAALATAPIHKQALQRAGVSYPGHTELIAALSGCQRFCMMLLSSDLVLTFVTTHIGLTEISLHLSPGRILEVIELTVKALQEMGLQRPRLAVCGLNPHAGEKGLLGNREEEELIQPAIDRARAAGMAVEGPFPADVIFLPGHREKFDAVICMYHDQGHIPFKMLYFDQGVNVTLGLPLVRTSVDHGTAFDIAWQGIARHQSMVAAIKWAARLAK